MIGPEKHQSGNVPHIRPLAVLAENRPINEPTPSYHEYVEPKSGDKDEVVVAGMLLFLALNIGLTGIDFWGHPHNAVSDPARRWFLTEMISPFFRHIGNYGITASLMIAIGMTKNILEEYTAHKNIKLVIKQLYLAAVACGLTMNGLVEDLDTHSDEALGDFAVGAWAIVNSVAFTELFFLSLNRIGKILDQEPGQSVRSK